jgi:hypothetical protein
MLKATPLELLTLQQLSRPHRRILAQNLRCWVAARKRNMHPPVSPPPRACGLRRRMRGGFLEAVSVRRGGVKAGRRGFRARTACGCGSAR